jgi:hypothetical protein
MTTERASSCGYISSDSLPLLPMVFWYCVSAPMASVMPVRSTTDSILTRTRRERVAASQARNATSFWYISHARKSAGLTTFSRPLGLHSPARTMKSGSPAADGVAW